MSTKTMYCNNCGEKGHVFKTCKDPIISCGIILVRGIYEPLKLPVDPKTVSVLMVKRKDSMSYMEFIRGKYDLSKIDYIKRLISNMTVIEQELIATKTFEELWTKLWGIGRDTQSLEFELSRDKFNSLDREKLIDECRSMYKDPEWGFPKGRRMRGESDLECGIREFFEETNIPPEAYKVIPELTYSEIFSGTNDVLYKHIYFVATLEDSKVFNLKSKLTLVQRREISAVDWKTLSECRLLIRPHYTARQQVINELERSIATFSGVAK